MNTLKQIISALIFMAVVIGIAWAIAMNLPLYYRGIPIFVAAIYLLFHSKIHQFLLDEETFEMSLVAFIAAPVAAIAAAFSFNYTLGIWALAFTLYKTHAFRHLHRAIGSGFKALFGSVVSSISKH